MAADYTTTCQLVSKKIELNTPLTLAWQEVASAITDGEVAASLLKHDVSSEARRMESWLLAVQNLAPIPGEIRGLYFGLFHPNRGEHTGCAIHLAGSQTFESQHDVWAKSLTYRAPMIFESSVLDDLYAVSSNESHIDNRGLVHVCLWLSQLLLADGCRRISGTLSAGAHRRGLGIGFDSGDLLTVGIVSAKGFHPHRWATSELPSRVKLRKGDYFIMEGGKDVLLCECTDRSVPRDLFRQRDAFESISLAAHINPAWPLQQGTFGSLSPFGCRLISSTIAASITAMSSKDVEFIPVTIKDHPGDWRAMHVLGRVRAYDREESTKRGALVLRQEAIGDKEIFFDFDYYEGLAVIVSRRLAQLMIEQGLTGVEFVPIAVK